MVLDAVKAGQEGVKGVLAMVPNAEYVVDVMDSKIGLVGKGGDEVGFDIHVREEECGKCRCILSHKTAATRLQSGQRLHCSWVEAVTCLNEFRLGAGNLPHNSIHVMLKIATVQCDSSSV